MLTHRAHGNRDRTGTARRTITTAAAMALGMAGWGFIQPNAAWAQVPEGEDVVAPGVDQPAGVEAEAGPADNVSGALGYDFASHFVSYGADVWGAGDDIYSEDLTNFVWANVAWDLAPVTVTLGVWSDINDNVVSGLGGSVQEVDVYAGAALALGDFTVGATYQEWYYASDEERIVDVSLSYDDSAIMPEGFSLSPAILAHFRVDGNGGQEEAAAIVGSIAPSFALTEDGDYPLTLTIPISAAYFEDEFQGGDSGFGYASFGATLSVPLAFIPAEYGDWAAAANATYYITDEDAIPNNPEDQFVTVTLSVSVAI